MTDRVRKIIDTQRARLREDHRMSAPVIVQHLLRHTDTIIADDRPALITVLGAGWDHFVRACLHRPTDLPTPEQLEFWPEALREHVLRIQHRAVFVPSRGKMVAILPGEITAAELREAGGYLRQKARETADRGRACERLADAMDRT